MKELREGEPCSHKGCLSHISHPCEGCGRIAGRNIPETTHVLDSIIQDIDNFRNEYCEGISLEVDKRIDKLAEIIHELVIILKSK